MRVLVYSIYWYSTIHNKNKKLYLAGNDDMDMSKKCHDYIWNEGNFNHTDKSTISWKYEGIHDIEGWWEFNDLYPEISTVSGFVSKW